MQDNEIRFLGIQKSQYSRGGGGGGGEKMF